MFYDDPYDDSSDQITTTFTLSFARTTLEDDIFAFSRGSLSYAPPKGPSWNRVNRLVKNEVDAKSQLTSSISFSNPFTFTLHNQTEFSTKNKETNHPLEYPPPLFFSVSVNPKEEDASDRSEPPLPKWRSPQLPKSLSKRKGVLPKIIIPASITSTKPSAPLQKSIKSAKTFKASKISTALLPGPSSSSLISLIKAQKVSENLTLPTTAPTTPPRRQLTKRSTTTGSNPRSTLAKPPIPTPPSTLIRDRSGRFAKKERIDVLLSDGHMKSNQTISGSSSAATTPTRPKNIKIPPTITLFADLRSILLSSLPEPQLVASTFIELLLSKRSASFGDDKQIELFKLIERSGLDDVFYEEWSGNEGAMELVYKWLRVALSKKESFSILPLFSFLKRLPFTKEQLEGKWLAIIDQLGDNKCHATYGIRKQARALSVEWKIKLEHDAAEVRERRKNLNQKNLDQKTKHVRAKYSAAIKGPPRPTSRALKGHKRR